MEIGVVIPTLDEAQNVVAALRSVGREGPGDEAFAHAGPPLAVEIVVVDGGSRDETCERARNEGARVIELPKDAASGRARQLQAGFEACEGDAVLFLHADTRLVPAWRGAVAAALADPAVAGGAFRFGFDRREAPSWPMKIVEWGARVRSERFGMPYGDQAIFVRRPVLEAIGGVPQVPMMEDLDLVDAIKRQGRWVQLEEPALTSARRYRARGTLRTVVRNALAMTAWWLGLDRERVARWYRR